MARYASTFLSHASVQKPLVEAVARELSRRGVLPWLDVNELPIGADLDIELRKANDAQLTLTAFLSEESIASAWCREELEPRLAKADAASGEGDAILPVFLGAPAALVAKSGALQMRWQTPDGARVAKLGIEVADPGRADPADIAKRLALTHFQRLGTMEADKVIIVLDQRGKGPRTGEPGLPPNWAKMPWPTLVFRPDMDARSEIDVLDPYSWKDVRDPIVDAIAAAFGTRTRREVYVTGNAQLAFAWLIGQQFDRSSGVKLVVHNPRGNQTLRIDFEEKRYRLPLPRVAPGDVTWHGGVAPDATTREVSVYIGGATFANAVHAHRAATGDATPLAVRETGHIESAEDVIHLAEWMATTVEQRPVTIYTTLPFHVVPLLAALLKHETGPVTLMEWAKGAGTYVKCPLFV